jgi:tetratricopeptide (TPR) repeat protein
VTIELAPHGSQAPLVAATDSVVRVHRLDRLRARRAVPTADDPDLRAPESPGPVPPPRDATAVSTLARALGGSVMTDRGASIVVVERRTYLPARLEALRELPDPVDPGRPIVCLDTETTGLGTAAGTLPFLVALGRWQGDEMVVRQLLLPDHPDEPAFLAILERHIPYDALLVTYNGRTFDWPLLASRYRLHGRQPPEIGGHLDLLHVARVLWRHRLSDARLSSVEAGIAGVRRGEDLPGACIPDLYFQWLRRGDPRVFPLILEHNHQDVVSLGLLLRVLAQEVIPRRAVADGEDRVTPRDLMGLGRLYARRGRHEDALACFEAALGRLVLPWRERELQAHLGRERARTLGRLGRREEARSAWEAVALEGGPSAPHAWIQVAKWLEHGARDIPAAIRAARRAEALAARLRYLGEPQPGVERDLARRLARLGAGTAAPPWTLTA